MAQNISAKVRKTIAAVGLFDANVSRETVILLEIMLMTTPTGDKLESDVTGRMIQAGKSEYFSFDSRFEDLEDALTRIWRAMEAARLKNADS